MTRFTPALFSFLRDLANNNDRGWFQAHKTSFERHVRQPALDFITEFGPVLEEISPHFRADARTVGGSLMRIHRDMRFSSDKTPYKTNVGIQFRHRSGSNVHAHGFYLHLEPAQSFIGVGIYKPATPIAYEIRGAIAERPAVWQAATSGAFLADFQLIGDSLVRAPRGFADDHPMIVDLKRKDFLGMCRVTQKEVTGDDFFDLFAERCRLAAPFMRFLCEGVGIPF